MSELDTYKTITSPTEEVLYKDRNSKFFGYAFPIADKNDAKTILESIKKQHHGARHWCYAYQHGIVNKVQRANDDGEPSNSAGKPILGQIQAFDVTNVLIVVVRYFGGVKLGVGGLINAYKTAAQLALRQATIIEKTIDITYQIVFDYKMMNKAMRVIKEQGLKITAQDLQMNCKITFRVRKKDAKRVYETFNNIFGIDVTQLQN